MGIQVPPYSTMALSCRTLIPRTAPFPVLILHVSNALFGCLSRAKSKSLLYPKHERATCTHSKKICPRKVIQTRGVSHIGLVIYIKKYLKAKEKLKKLKYFTMQKYNLQKILQNPSRYYYNSIITNLKFQHKPKYHLSKIII